MPWCTAGVVQYGCMTFPKRSYYRQIFSKLSSEGETIADTEFEGCTFIDCSFMNGTFQQCAFIDCTFTRCVVSAMKVTDSRFAGISFAGGKTIGIDWTAARHIEDIGFTDCAVDYCNFRMLPLPKAVIRGCSAKEADFTEADLTAADCSGTDFTGSVFFKTTMTGADFRGARNYYVDVRTNTVKGAKFSIPDALALLTGLEIMLE